MATTEDGTHPEIPDRQWQNPFPEGVWLHEEFQQVLRENRDIVIVLDDYYGRRGTGKTVASMQLAAMMDQTDSGVSYANLTMDPEELRNMYHELPPRSALVFDEGEVGASKYDSMTATNKALREIVSMGRVEQKYVIINTPIMDFIDRELQKLSTAWITMLRRGYGLVHHLKREPYSGQLLRPKKHYIEFEDIPRGTELRQAYNQLTQDKRSRIEGEESTGFMPEDEHKRIVEKRVSEAEKETRNEILKGIWDHDDIRITQTNLADVVDISQNTISNIVNER